MPVLAIIGFFGSFVKKWAGAIIRFGVMLTIVVFLLGFFVSFCASIIGVVYFALTQVNSLLDFINSRMASSDDMVSLFFSVLCSLGIIDAFSDAWSLFKPIFFTLITLLALKIVIKFVDKFKTALTDLFISRID
ncbi:MULTISPECIES: hypothetical protein [unclassified Campylobacter]|uniref:hypothetical protein n=1 Tax=unclassified Campylobacter TaxID=2593542 RepID=UPI0022E9C9C1|nr:MULTISPECIES: hypothetical protein [unclassified Campylobacter]MDA3056771.1 hypothetical protein [Campylobacter sp. CN_NA1]MDA3065940.1 hypothetical protein [Campylobacter sp. CN_NE4]MDA3069104.1 hypothetical protein [Campylobacter sp. CN_NE3]MDA3083266.1 hypothetical protein [Campylobacter sp. CN_EL2]MDA3084797.1 hypothetical protein [Campylobacter sp. CN_NE1]